MRKLNILQKSGLGTLELNSPGKLNSLDLEMVRGGLETIEEWESSPSVKAGMMKGAGAKAFCAGGDVVSVVNHCREQDKDDLSFFESEYRFDKAVHDFTKPLVVFAHGVTMGGGIGLMNGASHRIVTESTLMAMPEITIGFFPDVGSGRFLKMCPEGIGRFLGLTGARFRAEDALYLGLADYYVRDADLENIERELISGEVIDDVLGRYQREAPPSGVKENLPEIKPFLDAQSLAEFDQLAREYSGKSEWVEKSLATYKKGSPLSSAMTFHYLWETGLADWEETFKRELHLASAFVHDSDFFEGVRALLVDKDKNPSWKYPSFKDIPAAEFDRFFSAD